MKRGKKILLVAVLLCLCLIVYRNVIGERKRIRTPEDTDSEFYLYFGEEQAEQIALITLSKINIETYDIEAEIEITDKKLIEQIADQILALKLTEDESTDAKEVKENRIVISFNNGGLSSTLYVGQENHLLREMIACGPDTKMTSYQEVFIMEPQIDFEQWWELAALASSETITTENALSDFDYMWHVLENNYPFLTMAEQKYGLSMEKLKANFRGKIEALGSDKVVFTEYYDLLRECIGKLRGLAHLSILGPYEYSLLVAEHEEMEANGRFADLRDYRLNIFNDSVIESRYDYLAEEYSVSFDLQDGQSNHTVAENLLFEDISSDIAYVKINSFMEHYIEQDAEILEAWFRNHANTKYIIIDITGNGGGSDFYWAKNIVGPNLKEKMVYTSYVFTQYGEETREQLAIEGYEGERLNPNVEDLKELPGFEESWLQEANYYYTIDSSISSDEYDPICTGQFFLIVDEDVYSAADGFAIFCKETGFATVVGETTGGDGGGGGNLAYVKLPESGLLMQFRPVHSLYMDGTSRVLQGVIPDVQYEGKRGGDSIDYLGVCLDYIESLE